MEEAAEALGGNGAGVIIRHILPNIMAPVLNATTLGMGIIIMESS